MGKSFILKDRSGTAVGYFQQGIHSVRCRLSSEEEGTEIILFYVGGKHNSRLIEETGKEMEWKEADGIVEEVVISRDGVIIAASSPQARLQFERMYSTVQTNKKRDNPSVLPVEETHESQQIEEENKSKETAEKNRMPERRWPRPPCWQEAVYRQGMWTERQ